MVYHYTTIETFYNMLAAYRESEDKDNLVFWASNALNQNDSEELFLRADDIIALIRDLEEKGDFSNMPSYKKISTVQDQWWVPYLTMQDIKDDLNVCNTLKYSPYTISFSHQRDTLLMWTMYANNGNGICLAFEEEKIVNEQPSVYAIADDVIYDKDPKCHTNVIEKYLILYHKEIEQETIINDIYNKKRLFLITMLWGISPFMKNEAFKEEKEFRIAFFRDPLNSPKVYKRLTGRLNEIRYIKVKIPLASLNHIIVGPCADYSRISSLIVENMKSCEISRDYDKGFIQPSRVPYRLY